MVLLARAVGWAALLAVTVKLAKLGSGLGGAVYFPAALIVPIRPGLTPAGGVNDHVTAVLVAPVTLAVNCRISFTATVTLALGSSVTVTAPAVPVFAVNSETVAIITAINARTMRSSVLCRIEDTFRGGLRL